MGRASLVQGEHPWHGESIPGTGRASLAWAEHPWYGESIPSTARASWHGHRAHGTAHLKPPIPCRGSGEATGTPPATLCPHAGLPCARGCARTVSPAPVSPAQASPAAGTHQPEVLGAGAGGSAGSVLRPLLHGAEGSPVRCRAVRQRVAAGGDGACREGRGDRGMSVSPVPPLPPWGQGTRGGVGLGTSSWYLSGVGARAAAAPAPGAQPGPPPAGSAAAPGPAPRRSGPSSAAPPCLESPPPARPWGPRHPGDTHVTPGTPMSPQDLPCPPALHPPTLPRPLSHLGDVHLLHLGQGGGLEQDAGPWVQRRGARRGPGELEAGAGGQAVRAGVRDAGQGAVA